ncbi:GerAB/ArcD/ProY family transporter [Desulfuribacillus alkaliarsenatis]|uniref:Uncharacterized protein n=1 Tax=Desulfuribacillus alkaliarsenatis TaxID=766136 RepID=A0A1E5FYI5_9FIRM|nr:endospore germination permease [Desulfuribacillus alkaliarsenatis]OEF95635.1 hypothetical protein BHF68_12385 [Desulfuribacillus alkaliarsenatis]
MLETVNSKQAIFTIVMFITGSAIIFGVGGGAEQDIWIVIILSMLLVIPVLIMYARILEFYPGENLFTISKIVFGTFFGKFIIMLYTWYAFHLGGLVLRNFSEYIQIVSFPETPQIFTLTLMTIVTIYFVKSGIEVIGRWTVLFFPILLLVSLLVIMLSIPIMNPIYIRPTFEYGIMPVISNTSTVFAFPFAETVLFIMVFDKINGKVGLRKVYLYSLLIAGSMILLSSVKNVLVLGSAASLYYFPAHTAARLIEVGTFLQRIEVLTAIICIACGLIKISICLLVATRGIAALFNINDNKIFVFPTGLLMMSFAVIIYNNTIEMFSWATEIYKYYALPFQLLIPLILWLVLEIKMRKQKIL